VADRVTFPVGGVMALYIHTEYIILSEGAVKEGIVILHGITLGICQKMKRCGVWRFFLADGIDEKAGRMAGRFLGSSHTLKKERRSV